MFGRKKFKPEFDVIGIGGAAWDFLGIIEESPVPGEKIKIIDFAEQGGGQTGTAIATVARLGGKAAIIGATGNDEFGEKIKKSFLKEGVNITHLIEDKGKTSHIAFCFAHKSTGERTIFFNRGTKKLLKASHIDKNFIRKCRCLVVDTHHGEATIAGAKIALKSGIPVVTDIEREKAVNEELFRLGTHHIIPGRYLLEYTGKTNITKAMKEWKKKFKKKTLVVTLGEDGAIGVIEDEFVRQPAYRVKKVVDTTGAGDVFHGAFAYGLTLGYNFRKNLKFAALISGLKCRVLGGRAGIPDREELKNYWDIGG